MDGGSVVRHWWNGADGSDRLEVVVRVHADGDAYQVEARSGASPSSPGHDAWVATRTSLPAALTEARNQLAPGQEWIRVFPPTER